MFPQDASALVLSSGKLPLRSGNDVTGAHAQIKQTSRSVRCSSVFTMICIRRLCASIPPLLAQVAILVGAATVFDPLAALAQALAVPKLVQHVATGMDNSWLLTADGNNTFTVNLPNRTLSGNLLVLGIQCNGVGSIVSVKDSAGTNLIAGPSINGSSKKAWIYYEPNCAGYNYGFSDNVWSKTLLV